MTASLYSSCLRLHSALYHFSLFLSALEKRVCFVALFVCWKYWLPVETRKVVNCSTKISVFKPALIPSVNCCSKLPTSRDMSCNHKYIHCIYKCWTFRQYIYSKFLVKELYYTRCNHSIYRSLIKYFIIMFHVLQPKSYLFFICCHSLHKCIKLNLTTLVFI